MVGMESATFGFASDDLLWIIFRANGDHSGAAFRALAERWQTLPSEGSLAGAVIASCNVSTDSGGFDRVACDRMDLLRSEESDRSEAAGRVAGNGHRLDFCRRYFEPHDDCACAQPF
jgi:hypothetical protein